jgi:hypothetical protein
MAGVFDDDVFVVVGLNFKACFVHVLFVR